MPNRSCSTVQQVSKAKSQVLRCAYNCQMSTVPQTTELDGFHERHSLQFINKHKIKPILHMVMCKYRNTMSQKTRIKPKLITKIYFSCYVFKN